MEFGSTQRLKPRAQGQTAKFETLDYPQVSHTVSHAPTVGPCMNYKALVDVDMGWTIMLDC
jgi:hypothetical protein